MQSTKCNSQSLPKTADGKTPALGDKVWWERTLGEFFIIDAFGQAIAVPRGGGSPEPLSEMHSNFASAQRAYETKHHRRRRLKGGL